MVGQTSCRRRRGNDAEAVTVTGTVELRSAFSVAAYGRSSRAAVGPSPHDGLPSPHHGLSSLHDGLPSLQYTVYPAHTTVFPARGVILKKKWGRLKQDLDKDFKAI